MQNTVILTFENMCCCAVQVDLVGSEKLNNSMGFSMFFVGLGCLTGPPLAGEWVASSKTFSQTCANLLFEMHTDMCAAYVCYCMHASGGRGGGCDAADR